MDLAELLQIQDGMSCLIGSGGKTTMLELLGCELARKRRVLLSTSTHIHPFADLTNCTDNSKEQILAALDRCYAAHEPLCVGSLAQDGKLCTPGVPMDWLLSVCDVLLLEADGAKRLPAKAHASHEPVLPEQNRRTIQVFGLSALGKPVSAAAHRAEQYAKLSRIALDAPITPAAAARVIEAEALCDAVFLNQMDQLPEPDAAFELASRLTLPVYGGALQRGVWMKLNCYAEGAQ